MKLPADPQSDESFGGACVGSVGGELIPEIVAALAETGPYPAEAVAEHIPAPP